MRLRIELTGITPLLMHHPQLADPANGFAKEISTYTAKGSKQTDEDREKVKRLEWYGGLYTAPGIDGPVIPTANIRMSLREGATALKTRQGEDVLRAVYFTDLFVPLSYNGPRDIDELFADKTHTFEASVNPNPSAGKKRRIQKVRPCFPQWAVVADLELLTDVMNVEDFEVILSSAGRTVGLMDGRRIGHGRFTAIAKRLG